MLFVLFDFLSKGSGTPGDPGLEECLGKDPPPPPPGGSDKGDGGAKTEGSVALLGRFFVGL